MGSERLGHMFAAKDPTFKEDSDSKKHHEKKSSSHHSICHTCGTHPVAMSNGPASSSAPMIKHKPKTNSKYKKLIKLYRRQLSHIENTISAIESLSTTGNVHRNPTLASSRKRVDELSRNLENFQNSPDKQDHIHFEPLKAEIDQLIEDLKSYKAVGNDPHSAHTIDCLVGLPLDVSDSDNDEDKTLNYF